MPERTLFVDPGETTGWSLWEPGDLIDSGQTPLWQFLDAVYDVLLGEPRLALVAGMPAYELRELMLHGGVHRIVCEDFRIYPDKCKELAWDAVRTARGIGALTQTARVAGIPFVLQPAMIKQTAIAGGAEELFNTPLHENRHANDSIMHAVFYYVLGDRAPANMQYGPPE